MIFAGVGNRHLTEENRKRLTHYAEILKNMGLKCRSGGAGGSDSIFTAIFKRDCQILRPHHATQEARDLAGDFHPAWGACKPYVRDLHGRNAQIILGENLDHKAAFVLCVASSETQGGTSLGIKIARGHDIPVFNVYNKDHKFDAFLEMLEDNADNLK